MISLLLLAGCGTTATVSQYYMPDTDGFAGDEFPTAVRIKRQVSEELAVELLHVSHIAVGFPFDNRKEDQINAVGFELKLW